MIYLNYSDTIITKNGTANVTKLAQNNFLNMAKSTKNLTKELYNM